MKVEEHFAFLRLLKIAEGGIELDVLVTQLVREEYEQLQHLPLSHQVKIIGGAQESGIYNVRFFGAVARGRYTMDSVIDLLAD